MIAGGAITMKKLYQDYLFTKNILVATNNAELPVSYNVTENFSSLFAIASKYNIKINKGKNLADLNVLKYLESQIPGKVVEAFYRGFPESVKRLTTEELLFDQLLHYFDIGVPFFLM